MRGTSQRAGETHDERKVGWAGPGRHARNRMRRRGRRSGDGGQPAARLFAGRHDRAAAQCRQRAPQLAHARRHVPRAALLAARRRSTRTRSRDSTPAWYYEFDTYRGQEATPLVVDGVLYTTSAWSKVYAPNAKTGELHLVLRPEGAGRGRRQSVLRRELAAAPRSYDGKLIIATLDGRLIALDRQTGTLLWSTVTVDQTQDATRSRARRAS